MSGKSGQLKSGVNRCPWKAPKTAIRQSMLLLVRKLYKEQSVSVTAQRFGKHWSQMSPCELEGAFNYISALFDQRPKGSNWSDLDLSERVTASLFEGQIWTACLGFESRDSALSFCRHPGTAMGCVLHTEPRKASRATGWQWEVKVWCPEQAFLMSLCSRRPQGRELLEAA